MEKKNKISRQTIIIWILLLIGFGFMEVPGVFFFQHKSIPTIFGLPFIHGYMICCWMYMCAVTFYAYKSNWGRAVKEIKES